MQLKTNSFLGVYTSFSLNGALAIPPTIGRTLEGRRPSGLRHEGAMSVEVLAFPWLILQQLQNRLSRCRDPGFRLRAIRTVGVRRSRRDPGGEEIGSIDETFLS